MISPKSAAYASIASVEVRDEKTVVLHLKHAENF